MIRPYPAPSDRVTTGSRLPGLAWYGLVFLLLWALAPQARAEGPPPVPACTANRVALAPSSLLVADPARALTPDAVLQVPAAQTQPVIAGGRLFHSDQDWWLRVDLANATDRPCRRWLLAGPARLRDVRLYVQQQNGWQQQWSGAIRPLGQAALPERKPVFPVLLPPHSTTTVLLRIVGHGGLISYTPQLWAPILFQQAEARQAVRHGLIYGAVLLLALVSLVLGCAYRRPNLCFMALAVASYAFYLATQANYFFIYLWPASPALNSWARFFFSGLFFLFLYRYLYGALRARQLGAGWRYAAAVPGAAFLFLALFGGLLDNLFFATTLLFAFDQLSRWSLLIAGLVGWRRRTHRHVYPLIVAGLLCAQSVQIYGQLLGLNIISPGGADMFASTMGAAGVALLLTLCEQAYQGRQAELQSRALLAQRRATEAERLERIVTRRTSELQQALETRRQLLGRISHDLRAPLAGILASISQWRAGDRRRDYPRLIERQVRRHEELLDELLTLSRAELADREPEPVVGPLPAFLNDLADQAELAAEQHGNRLRREFADDLPPRIEVDFLFLQRVLSNLLGNASKFTERGNIRFAVQVCGGAGPGRQRLRFTIDDDGPGIAPADRQRLLQPYARGAHTEKREGHGLGLAIVTELLGRLGGQLQIEPAPGGGSRFWFELELAVITDSEPRPVDTHHAVAEDLFNTPAQPPHR